MSYYLLRHSSKPLYTPEPDICHELMGHAPMFADEDFADFSQQIGLASLGASDEDVDRLAKCYWYSVEFGLTQEAVEGGNPGATALKAYGAGLLSSFGELAYSCDPLHADPDADPAHPAYLPWEPAVAATTPFPITRYQPVYFVAESLADAKKRMRTFCEELARPFYAKFNPLTSAVWVDRAVAPKIDKCK